MADEMAERHLEWTWDRKNLLLGEFGLGPLEGYNEAPNFEELIGDLNDDDLVEMFAIVAGVEPEEVRDRVDSSADAAGWRAGYVRLFISHSARHKAFVGQVADELAITGIHGFVAHDTMEWSKPWQAQIERALRSMQAFVAIVHDEFNESPWCHQEVGWALGRRVPKFIVRMGADPRGFPGQDQWPSGFEQPARQVAQLISSWASSVPELGETMADGLFAALASVGNYQDAGATASRVAALNDLTADQWARLDQIWWQNDQLYTGALPTKALRPFYLEHGRDWPPPKPSQAKDPWESRSGLDEPPF